ncbi:trypsin-like serine protease [Streptomyces sp. NPDC007984]|uniref:S1 family peptidase n=1 Tax=Streptomyces sp. NPDC007984 TaxID=3364801 RepID=UPI0036F02CCE
MREAGRRPRPRIPCQALPPARPAPPDGDEILLRRTATWLAALAIAAASATPAFAVSGGHEVRNPSEAPWMVTISSGDGTPAQRFSCGGVLISPIRIATAGHCLDHANPRDLEIRVGGGPLSTRPGRLVHMRGFAIHPNYRTIPSPKDPQSYEKSGAADDVAVILLTKPVRGVHPVPVARHAPAVDSRVRVYGHGLTKPPTEKDPSPVGDVLRRADMKVIGDRTCNSRLEGVVDDTSVLCAQAPRATICSGDSGGPLLKRGRRGPELAGIVSFGSEVLDKACVQGHPSAFADAAKLRGWLTQPRPTLVPMPAGKLTITGRQQAGSKLTCHLPRWAGKAPDSVKYQWFRSVTGDDGFTFLDAIDGGTGATLTLTKDLARSAVSCQVEATSAGGTIALEAMTPGPA